MTSSPGSIPDNKAHISRASVHELVRKTLRKR
jgi:hypothetical protein